MARLIGVSKATYQFWEYGTHAPGARHLMYLERLIPDAETARIWGLSSLEDALLAKDGEVQMVADSNDTTGTPNSRPQPKSPKDVKKLRARTMAIQAIQILYEAALDGAPGAEEKLAAMADSLLESAGKYDRAKPRGK